MDKNEEALMPNQPVSKEYKAHFGDHCFCCLEHHEKRMLSLCCCKCGISLHAYNQQLEAFHD